MSSATSITSCTQALASACPGKDRTQAGVLRCDACTGINQARLRSAGCSASVVQTWCSAAAGDGSAGFLAAAIAAGKLTFFTFYDFWLNPGYKAPPYSFNFTQAAAILNAPTLEVNADIVAVV